MQTYKWLHVDLSMSFAGVFVEHSNIEICLALADIVFCKL
jgi:hypothetical protein